MKEYEVKLYETVIHRTFVNADSEDDAYDKAYEVIANGQQDQYTTEADSFTGDWSAEEVTP